MARLCFALLMKVRRVKSYFPRKGNRINLNHATKTRENSRKNHTRPHGIPGRVAALFLLLVCLFGLAGCGGCVFPFSPLPNDGITYSTEIRGYDAAAVENGQMPPAKDLLSAIETPPEDETFSVGLVLAEWGFAGFTLSKVEQVEATFRAHYYKELEAPTILARGAADLFLTYLYNEIDLSDSEKLTEGLIDCFIGAVGDRYAVYRSPEAKEDYTQDMSGELVGIGVTVSWDPQTSILKVVSLIPGGPAEEAGILANDRIIAVDGVIVAEAGYDDTVAAIQGEVGTRVQVTVLRDGEEHTFEMTRRKIESYSVYHSIGEDGLGYIQITGFKSNTYRQFAEAVDALEAAGVRGIVFDVRNNPGGYLAAVERCLDYLVPRGTQIVSFSDGTAPYKATTEHTLSVPAVVLCNEYTASAGELFAAALRDFRDLNGEELLRTQVVGTTTYKKGVMQNTFTYRDGSALTLTVAYYNPPSGVNYDGVGVVPDVTETDPELQLAAAYEQLALLCASSARRAA